MRRLATVLIMATLGTLLLMRSIVSIAAPVPVSVELYDFGIRLSPQTVAAGEVVFTVRNVSKNTVHEMIVAATFLAPDQLPYEARSNRVEEKKLRSLGEVSDLPPGASGHLTLRMKPGTYVLLCNEPGHYKAGMVRVFTVTR
jgi:uncharacterized cupredoxin-like copper-binding protein